MDRADDFINAKDTLKALTTPQRTELEEADKKAARQKSGPNREGGKKGALEAQRRGGASAWVRCGPHAHMSLVVEGKRAQSLQKEPRQGQKSGKYYAYQLTDRHSNEDCYTLKRSKEELEGLLD